MKRAVEELDGVTGRRLFGGEDVRKSAEGWDEMTVDEAAMYESIRSKLAHACRTPVGAEDPIKRRIHSRGK